MGAISQRVVMEGVTKKEREGVHADGPDWEECPRQRPIGVKVWRRERAAGCISGRVTGGRAGNEGWRSRG